MVLNILIYLSAAFVGYTIGRIGHIYGGDIPGPHHWIYGAVLMFVGMFFISNIIGLLLIYFGAGVFISDSKDFLLLRIWGVDDVKVKKFWHID